MEKKLITEIRRIHKMMGIQQNLLVEGVTPKISDFIKGFFKEFQPITSGKNFEIGGITVNKSEYEKIKNAITDPKKYFNNLSSDSKKLIARIIGNNQNYVENLYTELVSDILKKEKKTEENLIKGIMNDMEKNNRDLQESLEALFEDDFVAEVLFNKFRKKREDIILQRFEPTKSLVKPKKELDSGIKSKIQSAVKTDDLKSSEDLTRFRKFLASNKTIFNVFRRLGNDIYIKFEKKVLDKIKKDELFIQKIFEDIIRTSNKLQGGMSANVDEIVIELRDISQKIKTISDENKADWDSLVEEFRVQMKEQNLTQNAEQEFDNFFKNLKENNPFRENATITEKSWALREWLNTSTSNTTESLLKLRFLLSKQYKKALDAIGDLISRIPLFLMTASPKSFKEFSQYFTEYGALKGFWKLYQHLWLATKIGMPVFYAVYDVIVNLWKLRFTKTKGEEGKYDDAFDEFGKRYLQHLGKEYKWRGSDEFTVGSVIAGILAPGHLVGKDLLDWFTKKTAKIESGEARPEITAEEMFEIAKKNGVTLTDEVKNKLKQQIEDFKKVPEGSQKEWLENQVKNVENKVENVKSQAETQVNNIEGSETGCKLFLKTKGKEMKSYLNGICLATDGTEYEWDGTKYNG